MRVLIADDDRVTRELLRAHLSRWGYDVETVRDGEHALRVLASADGPRLALLDWVMPKLDGPAVCKAARALPGPYRYLILVTSRDRKLDVVAGLEAGADDYVTKPIIPAELQARLRPATRILDLEAELLAIQERLRIDATRDALTGLWNRRALVEALEREAARARREKRPVSLLLGDLDRFKAVNDQFGHGGGDAVLKAVAARMVASVREYDTVGRYGGEELAVVLPDADAASAKIVAERILEAVRGAPVPFDGNEIATSISIGAATCVSGCCPMDAMIRRADEALYRAKHAGRGRVECAIDPVGCPEAA